MTDILEKVILERTESNEHGVFGQIVLPDRTLFTAERPWLNNANMISCVPVGEYRCEWTFSQRFQRKLYELQDVPGRTSIRIHPANYVHQLNGCIALGTELKLFAGELMLFKSGIAVESLHLFLKLKPFILEIRDAVVPNINKES